MIICGDIAGSFSRVYLFIWLLAPYVIVLHVTTFRLPVLGANRSESNMDHIVHHGIWFLNS